MCRLIMNAILLKYAGIMIALGGTENEKSKYLAIATNASIIEQTPEDERGDKPAWAELATLVLRKSVGRLENWRDELKSVKSRSQEQNTF